MENRMKESELLGKLMPGHPDVLPILEKIREKYQLPEVDSDADKIKGVQWYHWTPF
jgi:hypothetical protein